MKTQVANYMKQQNRVKSANSTGSKKREERHLCCYCPADHQVCRRQLRGTQLPRLNNKQRSKELDSPGHPSQRMRGVGEGSLCNGEVPPSQYDRGDGLPHRNGHIQGYGGHLHEVRERYCGLHLLEQL